MASILYTSAVRTDLQTKAFVSFLKGMQTSTAAKRVSVATGRARVSAAGQLCNVVNGQFKSVTACSCGGALFML